MTEKLTTRNLYQRLLDITSEIGKIEKTGKNSIQGYAFIEQAKIVAELRPQLSKHGVMILPETVARNVSQVANSNGKTMTQALVTSRYHVINADDPADRIVLDWDSGEALDTSDKATNKAITASQKTFLMKLFNISDQDDPDTHSPDAPDKVLPPSKPVFVDPSADVKAAAIERMNALGFKGQDALNMSEVLIGKKLPKNKQEWQQLLTALNEYNPGGDVVLPPDVNIDEEPNFNE